LYRLTPKEEISSRLAAFREILARERLDAAVVVQNADLFYLAGSIQQGILVVPAEGDPVYFVRKVYERAVAESRVEAIVRIASPREVPAYFDRKGISFNKVGFELDVMPVATFRKYASLFPQAQTGDISSAIRELRAVKGAWEIEAMRVCGRSLAALLAGAGAEIRQGMTEMELQGVLQGKAIAGGHTTVTRMRAWNQEVGLGCVISGPDAALPSYADFPTAGKGSSPYVPTGHTGREFTRNEPIIVDLMWDQGGYLVDMARTYVIGKLPEKLTAAYDLSLKILRNVESAVRPGAVAGDLYEIAVEMASRSRFAGNFMGAPGYNVKFIGHGIGIEADEHPFLSKGSRTVLSPGMTFAMEPKFVFPGEGAVGLENSYLVTESGWEKLTSMEEDVVSCNTAKPVEKERNGT
jgi:Xaa-Pro dipeptidase